MDSRSVLDNISKVNTSKIRRPPSIDTWFGFNTTDESSEEEEGWSEVERVRKKEEKRKKTANKRKEMKKECASRAACMASMGPITRNSINFFRDKGEDFEVAKKSAVREFLTYYFNYDENDFEEFEIKETRLSTKDDNIVNVALSSEDAIRNLYIRKAEMRLEDITLRTYIPPNFHERFMGINRICTERRSLNPLLKTQLRFGKRDVEIYTKIKGDDIGFRKVSIEDFIGDTTIPDFDRNIKWKRYLDRPPRRTTNQWESRGQRPSTQNKGPAKTSGFFKEKTQATQPMTRANSNSLNSTSKKQKLYNEESSSSSGEEEDEQMEDATDTTNEEPETDRFATPASK